jgi:hypothetical protein
MNTGPNQEDEDDVVYVCSCGRAIGHEGKC